MAEREHVHGPDCAGLSDDWHRANRMLEQHVERMSRLEYQVQIEQHRKRRRSPRTFRFSPSATIRRMVEMMGDPSTTTEDVVAFIHAPGTHAWNTSARMAGQE